MPRPNDFEEATSGRSRVIRLPFGRSGNRICFDEGRKVAECFVLAVLRRSPREPPSDGSVEDGQQPLVVGRNKVRGVIREVIQ